MLLGVVFLFSGTALAQPEADEPETDGEGDSAETPAADFTEDDSLEAGPGEPQAVLPDADRVPEEAAAKVSAPLESAPAEGVPSESGKKQASVALDDVEEPDEPEFEAVAEVEAPPRQATKRSMGQEQLTRVPGTRGDALRAIEVMPGVGRSQFATNPGPPSLRGGSSGESLVVINGAQVPLLYHFGGLTSFFNSHLLEEVTLYPGNFSSRYGRAGGGVVEMKVRDPRSDGVHGLVELSAIDSQAVVESPLGKTTSVALAARRSNIDLFFAAAVPDDAATVIAAPVYWDYQAIALHRFDEANKLRVMVYGSQDRLELVVADSAVTDPALSGEISNKTSFHRFHVELESKFSEVVKQYLMFSVGPNPGRGSAGDIGYDFSSTDNYARAEWAIFAAPWLRVDAGFDFLAVTYSAVYHGPTPPPLEGNPSAGSLASESFQSFEGKGGSVRPGAFAELSLRPAENLLLVPGVRADYYVSGDDWALDPRFASRFEVVDGTTVKAGLGYYSQAPQYWEAMDVFGNVDIQPYRVLQTSVGVEQKVGQGLTLDAEGFYKDWDKRIVGTVGGAPPRYENTGAGYAYGLELLVDYRLTEKTQTFASYTLSRSRRTDRPGDSERFFDFDQTHNLSLTCNYDLGKGWLIGARFRYVTGNPYSAVRGSVYDANSDTYRPLYSGMNDDRSPAFHQLDVRGEKQWHVGPINLTAFLEVFNAYNAKNEESRQYSFDYTQSEPVLGMPLFPNVGFSGEF